MKRFFKDESFDFLFRIVLGATGHNCADPGEVFACHSKIKDGKPDSWFDEWVTTADRVEQIAIAAAAAGHQASAWCAYLRAATYYDAATYMSDQTKDPTTFLPTWEKHRHCWDSAIDIWPSPVARVEIPYEGTSLPGYFFNADSSFGGSTDAERPLLIFNNGSDGAMTAAWVQGAAAALARGYNVLTFDGPGQQAALLRQGMVFRPDWEAVITPVVDFALGLGGVDARRVALIGVSQGGYWVPRALAFEKRIAAAVVDPGVYDVGSTWRERMPERIVKYVDSGDREKFERDMGVAFKMMKGLKARLDFRMRPFGLNSLFDVLVAVRDYSLDGVVDAIDCPILITNPENETFWPGQSERLYAALTCEKEIVSFRTTEGADYHCEPLSTYLREQRIFDWLDSKLN